MMKQYLGILASFTTLLIATGCNKKEETQSAGAAVLSQSEGQIIVSVAAGAAQEFGVGTGDIAGTYVSIPAGVLGNSLELTVQSGTTLNHPYLSSVFEIQNPLNVVAAGPAVEIRPSDIPNLTGEYALTIPKGEAVVNATGNLAVLYKGIDDAGVWNPAILGSGFIADGQSTITIKPSHFGKFQVVLLDTELNNNIDFANAGSGPWYGIEFDLYSQFANPEPGGPDSLLMVFDGDGSMQSSTSNGQAVVPPPSFNFEALITDYPTVFDSSSSVQVQLGLFTEDFEYGFWIDYRTNENLLTSRVIQRTEVTELPTAALDINAISGNYKGVSATTTIAGFESELDQAFPGEELTLSVAETNISVTGTLRDEAVEGAAFALVEGATGQGLGFMKGTITIASKTYTGFLIPSFDNNAVALVVCGSAEDGSCPVGDGTGTYQARSMFFGLFEKR